MRQRQTVLPAVAMFLPLLEGVAVIQPKGGR